MLRPQIALPPVLVRVPGLLKIAPECFIDFLDCPSLLVTKAHQAAKSTFVVTLIIVNVNVDVDVNVNDNDNSQRQ